MIKPKKNPVTKLIGAGIKAATKANARGLKAAQGKSLASPVKKAAAKKNAKERAMVKRIAQANKSLNMKEPYATKDAMRLADRIKASKKTSNSLVKQLKKDAPKLAIGPAIAGATLSIPSVRKNIKNQISESKKNKAKVTKKK
jgi:hypothetical protein